jgi:tetratricopeptide (TPR) repeat protein
MKKITTRDEYTEITLSAANDYNRRDYEQALDKFKKMAGVNYENDKIHEVLAYIYLNLGNIEMAEKEFAIFKKLMSSRRECMIRRVTVSFEDLLETMDNTMILEVEHEQVMESEKLQDPDEAIRVVSELACRYMSEGNNEQAELVLSRFKERWFPDEDQNSLSLNHPLHSKP